MRFVLALLALILTASDAMAQVHPTAELLKPFPVKIYEAAKVAEKVATDVDTAFTKAIAEMKKAEVEFRLAVEKEEDMEKFVLSHTRYMKAAMTVLKSSDGLGDANMAVSRLYFSLTEADDAVREILFLDWLKLAHKHELGLRLRGAVDDALIKSASTKMMAFIGK